MDVVEPADHELSSIFTSIHRLHHSIRSLEKEQFESPLTPFDFQSKSTPFYPELEPWPATDRLVNDELIPLDSKRVDASLSGRLQHDIVVASFRRSLTVGGYFIQIDTSWPSRYAEVLPLQATEAWKKGLFVA
jgi:hypothetical protein